MHMQYAATLQPKYKDYGGRENYVGHNNYRGRGGRGAQSWGNWWGGCGGHASSDLKKYCWKHGIYTHQGTDWIIPTEGYIKNAVWRNKSLGSKRNCTWQVGLVPTINFHIIHKKTSFTSKLLCRSIVDTPKHATINVKSDIGASNNYWRTEYQLVITDIKDTHNGPEVQLPNNFTMYMTQTGNIPLSSSLIPHTTNVHSFDGLQSGSLISFGKLCDNDCISILDKNEINVIKYSKIKLNGGWNKSYGLWDIPISKPLRHGAHEIITRYKKIQSSSSIHMDVVSDLRQENFWKQSRMETSSLFQDSTIKEY